MKGRAVDLVGCGARRVEKSWYGPSVRAESPVAIENLRPVSSGALVWRRSGRLSLTIVVKATLALVNEGTARLGPPADLCQGERALRAGASILADSDMVPYKPRVDVTFVGFAWAPRPVQGLRARVAVYGEGEVMEKGLQVVGERSSATAQPSPFIHMPIVYERAWTGLQGENPLGVSPHSGRIANLFDPSDPNRPAGFGPISRAFPARQRLLGGVDPRSLEAPTADPNGSGVWSIDVPGSLPFEFFLASPVDQRLDLLSGHETLLLENLVEGQSRLHTRLPGIKALAKVFGATLPPGGQPIDLVGDTLAIDGNDKTVSLTWRGTIPIPGTDSLLRSLHVMTGVEHQGYPMQWPSTSLRSTVDLANGAPAGRRGGVPAMLEELTPMLGGDDEASGSTKALSPEEAMKLLAGAKRAIPFVGNAAPGAPEQPGGRAERTLSPDEAIALTRKLAEHVPSQAEAEPALQRATLTTRRQMPHVEVPLNPPLVVAASGVAGGATARPEAVAPVKARASSFARPEVFPAQPVVHTGPMPAILPATAAAPLRSGQPDIVVRAPRFQASTPDVLDDEDSSIGSTVAFSPEAAAELIARKVASQGGATPPPAPVGSGSRGTRPPPGAQTPARVVTAPAPPPPAPPPQAPPPPMAHAAPPMVPMMDEPADSSGGSTMAFSPEAAAELIAQRMAQLGGARMPLPGGPLTAPPAPPPPAPPPPAPPPPAGPVLTRSNTIVMDVPAEVTTPQGRKLH